MEAIILGYSGHAYVAIEILTLTGVKVVAYMDKEEKKNNPYHLTYLGPTEEVIFKKHQGAFFFIGIGDIATRKTLFQVASRWMKPISVIHPKSSVSKTAELSEGVFIGANVVINAFAKIGQAVICNTGSVIEHEATIDDFSHIAPSSIICGRAHIGKEVLVGSNTTVIPSVEIGERAIIGAGTTVIKRVNAGDIIVGNPGKTLHN